jgi:L-asparaginase/Glu-tRNA(Gln) amidotransferase subunit D
MKILVIITGGTFGSKKSKNGLNTFNVSEIKEAVEELIEDVDYEIRIPFFKLSENIEIEDLKNLAEVILNSRGFDGVLIIHGTDTMVYTASALSFIEKISKKFPVVLTGANYPLFYEKSDAKTNFLHALKALKFFIKERIKGVFIVFNGINDKKSLIYRGVNTKKISVNDRCYSQFFGEVIGFVDDNVIFNKKVYNNIFSNKIVCDLAPVFNNKDVAGFKLYPGFDYSFLSLKKYTLLETYPSLTANADAIISNMKKGFEYFAVSPASVNEISYETTRKLQKNGVRLLFMTFESAIIKLMLCAGNNKIECMEKNIIGEL